LKAENWRKKKATSFQPSLFSCAAVSSGWRQLSAYTHSMRTHVLYVVADDLRAGQMRVAADSEHVVVAAAADGDVDWFVVPASV
jgi:hypothetical protein